LFKPDQPDNQTDQIDQKDIYQDERINPINIPTGKPPAFPGLFNFGPGTGEPELNYPSGTGRLPQGNIALGQKKVCTCPGNP
jgi:hypothetical protein